MDKFNVKKEYFEHFKSQNHNFDSGIFERNMKEMLSVKFPYLYKENVFNGLSVYDCVFPSNNFVLEFDGSSHIKMGKLKLTTKLRNDLYNDVGLNWGSINYENVSELGYSTELLAQEIEKKRNEKKFGPEPKNIFSKTYLNLV
jgi:hypothetical protein